jgi:hypothetical protein
MTEAETTTPAAAAADTMLADIPGVYYWSCESKLHKLCLEADQRPKNRPWSDVMEYITAHPDDAAKMAATREGDICLTPLVSLTLTLTFEFELCCVV